MPDDVRYDKWLLFLGIIYPQRDDTTTGLLCFSDAASILVHNA